MSISQANGHSGLKRSLSLPLAVFYGLGNILGAGIYVLIGKVAGVAGYFTPLAFLFSALIVVASAFTYAELVSRYPRSAGEAVYVQEAFGIRALSTFIGLLIAIAGIVSSAALVRGFIGYLKVFTPVNEFTVIIVVVVVLGMVAIWGISQSVKIVALVTILEIFGLLAVVIAGLGMSLPEPQVVAAIPEAQWDNIKWSGIWYGAFLAFYAFLGFEDMVNIAEEVKRPRLYLPIAIIIALVMATLMYISVSFVAVKVLSPEVLAASDAPLAAIFSKATGASGNLIAAIGLLAVINGALAQIIMSSRILFGMGRQGWISPVFSNIWPATRTPVVATLVTTAGVIVMAVMLPLLSLAAVTSLLLLFVFALVNVALIRIKLSERDDQTVIFKIPLWVPMVGVVTALGLAVFSLTTF